MNRKVLENCVVSIESKDVRKVLWLEEYTDDEGVITGYKVQKSTQIKSDVNHLEELKHLIPDNDDKNKN